MTKYKQNLITGKIRALLQRKPDAGYDDMFELFGPLNRSLRVTFYKTHKEMFGEPGSLKRSEKRKTPVRDKIAHYFAAHPDHTLDEAAQALNMDRSRVYAIVYVANQAGADIKYRKKIKGAGETSIAQDIRSYIKDHPETTSKDCAKALGVKPNYVSLIRYRIKLSNRLLQKRCVNS